MLCFYKIKKRSSKSIEIQRRRIECMRSRKLKNFSLPIFDYKSKLFKKRRNNIATTKKMRIYFSNDFSCDMKSPSSTKEIRETGIFRFLNIFSQIWKIGER